MKFRNWYNARNLPRRGTLTIKPTLTVPDQSMSIPEILKRYASGAPLGGSRVPIYDGEESEDISYMDKVEQVQHAKNVKAELDATKDRLNTKAKEVQERKKAEKLKKELEQQVRNEQKSDDALNPVDQGKGDGIGKI